MTGDTAHRHTADRDTRDRHTADRDTRDRHTADRDTRDRHTADRETRDRETADQDTADRDAYGSGVESFADLARRIRAAPPRLGPVRLVAIDGPSGAGKTTFARHLASALGGAPVLHTDDLLDGWDDQFTFWTRLEEQVLEPLRHGRPATYLRYLWHRRRFGGAPVTVEPAGTVLLEGVTAARSAIRPELSLAVFVTAPADLRLRRAVERHQPAPGAEAPDRVALRAYLERWRAAEDRHFAADSTAAYADLLVDGAAGVKQDADGRYVRLTDHHERA